MQIGKLAFAETGELDAALSAAQRGFDAWKRVPAFERYKTLRMAADLVRQRAEDIAACITREQGKPLAESRAEAVGAADRSAERRVGKECGSTSRSRWSE